MEQAQDSQLTVYTQNRCMKCKFVMKHLDKNGVTYDTINIDDFPEERKMLKASGFSAMPVVTNGVDWVSDNKPDEIMELV